MNRQQVEGKGKQYSGKVHEKWGKLTDSDLTGDLEELKRRGERNYYEFTVPKTKTPQRVGPVQITLDKVDQKKSKYTMTVFADDKSIEKKDKTAGEPVQFYVKGTSRMSPYEVVMFGVGKNQINGYLSTPKDTSAAAASTPAATAPTSKP